MSGDRLQRYQVLVYLAAVAAGLGLAAVLPETAAAADLLLWPSLGLLLYVTFTQVPLAHLPAALRDRRFLGAALVANFVVVPLVVAALLAAFAIGEPALRLGVLMVLLAPCTDWFITFTHLGRGDTRLAIAVTPVHLALQVVLLPVYVWLFTGDLFTEIVEVERIALVFAALLALPLAGAWATERWAERRAGRAVVVERLGRLPVPLLAVVVFLVATSQATAAREIAPGLAPVVAVFVAYAGAAALVGVLVARAFRLPTPASRTLVFSVGTRNSFVVLPLALALAPAWQGAAIVIVLQSLVELGAMAVYLWAVPRHLLPERGG